MQRVGAGLYMRTGIGIYTHGIGEGERGKGKGEGTQARTGTKPGTCRQVPRRALDPLPPPSLPQFSRANLCSRFDESENRCRIRLSRAIRRIFSISPEGYDEARGMVELYGESKGTEGKV